MRLLFTGLGASSVCVCVCWDTGQLRVFVCVCEILATEPWLCAVVWDVCGAPSASGAALKNDVATHQPTGVTECTGGGGGGRGGSTSLLSHTLILICVPPSMYILTGNYLSLFFKFIENLFAFLPLSLSRKKCIFLSFSFFFFYSNNEFFIPHVVTLSQPWSVCVLGFAQTLLL